MIRIGDALNVAVDLARRAGTMALSRVGDVHTVEFKGAINIVTEVDRESEALIVSGLRARFPDHAILAEEGTGDADSSPYRWIIDPLDGTVNYAHRFPFFCVSIVLTYQGELQCGVVFDPNRNECFTAIRGRGATLNGVPIRVSEVAALKRALVATGFAYNVQEGERLNNLDHFGNFVRQAQAVRRPGSAAIDLAWVAMGRIDGFWELFLKPWDIAAGVLLIREAGGCVTSFDESTFDLYGTEILASNGRIHTEMSQVLTRKGP